MLAELSRIFELRTFVPISNTLRSIWNNLTILIHWLGRHESLQSYLSMNFATAIKWILYKHIVWTWLVFGSQTVVIADSACASREFKVIFQAKSILAWLVTIFLMRNILTLLYFLCLTSRVNGQCCATCWWCQSFMVVLLCHAMFQFAARNTEKPFLLNVKGNSEWVYWQVIKLINIYHARMALGRAFFQLCQQDQFHCYVIANFWSTFLCCLSRKLTQ